MTNWPDPSSIRAKRKRMDLTQQQLAKLSGVRQSMISRIEDGKIGEPSYHVMARLFDALDNFEHRGQKGPLETTNDQEIRAKDLMNRNVISVSPHDKVKTAWDIIKKHNFSQLPVIDTNGRPLGSVILQSSFPVDLNGEEIGKMRVEDIMEDPFIIIGKDTIIQRIAVILRQRHEHAVLVIDKGRIVGIITPYDLMENAFHKGSNVLR
jgi:predicted transcriptional regulator